MSGGRADSWLIFHLRYLSPAARHHLIVDWFSRLGDGTRRRWYFVDVRLTTAERIDEGLELAVQCPKGDQEVRAHLHSILHGMMLTGLVEAISRVESSLAVQATFFPADVEPPLYRDALAAGSVRAAGILRSVAAGADGASDSQVLSELGCTHRALAPRDAWASTLRWQAEWLERLAGAGEQIATPLRGEEEHGGARVADEAGAAAPDDLDASYRGMRTRLWHHATAVADRLRSAGHESGWRRENVRAAVVARLAHTQTVRLWGPATSNLTAREAAHLRTLAREAESAALTRQAPRRKSRSARSGSASRV